MDLNQPREVSGSRLLNFIKTLAHLLLYKAGFWVRQIQDLNS